VNHLALSTTDMKGQLEFWCDVLGLPLKALYWMHGAKGAYHGFVELAPDSYVAFVQMPENSKDIEYGVSHANGPGGGIRGGTMQHVAFHVDSLSDILAMRDRLRSRGVQVLGPIDHGFTQSIYFDGPESLNLEISCGTHIDGEAWIDPEVVGLCGITEAELAALKEPTGFEPTAEPVPQPARPHPSSVQDDEHPAWHARVMALTDEQVWEQMSETTPPVSPEV
jgi:catechol 2,3-dioxygenase-like lactoylglutathione lyase family enzyme